MEPAPEIEISKVSFASYARLLGGNRNFRRLWSAQVVSEIGDWFYTLAIYNLLLQLTGRAGSVALALVLQVLPLTLIGPTAGVVNDRLRRKHVMISSDVGRMLIVLCMLLIRSKEKVWLAYPLLMSETLLVAFFEPARNAIIPNIVEREDVVVANTVSSTTWSVNLMVGATLGGVVAALLGRDAVFLLNALSFLVSAALIWGMRFAEPHAEGGHPFRARELVDFSPIIAGIRYVRSQVRLRSTIFVKFGNLIIGPGWVLFTVMGQNEFAVRWHGMAPERGAFLGMSLLLGARGLGALLGPLLARPGRGIGGIAWKSRSSGDIWRQARATRCWVCRGICGRRVCASRWRILEVRSSGCSRPLCCRCKVRTNSAGACLPPTSASSCSRLPRGRILRVAS